MSTRQRRTNVYLFSMLLALLVSTVGCDSSDKVEPGSTGSTKSSGDSSPGTDVVEVPPSINVGAEFDADLFQYSHQGSGFFPMSIIRALNDCKTGRPFLENLERFGLLPGQKSQRNPEGFPVGIVTNEVEFAGHKIEMFGFTCAACHTSDIRYNGKTVRVEGGSGLFYVDALGDAVGSSIQALLEDPEEVFAFLKRYRAQNASKDSLLARLGSLADLDDDSALKSALLKHFESRMKALQAEIKGEIHHPSTFKSHASDHLKSVAAKIFETAKSTKTRILEDLQPSHIQSSLDHLEYAFSEIHYRLDYLKVRGWLAKKGNGVAAGYGRADDFGTARVELFAGWNPKNMVPITAPVSTPPFWNVDNYAWLHWNANTNSVIQRSIGEAVGVGATFDSKTMETTVDIVNQMLMEKQLQHFKAPDWQSELFGEPDAAKVEQGQKLYQQHCAKCHDPAGVDEMGLIVFNLYTLEETGTDPADAVNFDLPVYKEDDSTVSFAAAIGELLEGLQETAKKSMSAENQALMDELEAKHTPVKWRDTMTETGGPVYPAKPLQGVWATAPYLHNGSVPTIYHLLLPVDQRPAKFLVGQKDFDPVHIGFELDPQKITAEKHREPFELDTSIPGNHNTGHEFGTDLSDDDRWALIEYLKVHVDPPAADPEN